jgi:uncharacterized membrane protein
MTETTRFRAVVLLALGGLFVALYLLLYHLGYYGALVCGTGSCEVVQTSEYARFLGQPVPLWGVLWYAGVLLLGLLSMGPVVGKRWAQGLLALAVAGGVLFSTYLTAIELFVLHAVCMWCVVSAVLTVLIFILARPWSFLRKATQAG